MDQIKIKPANKGEPHSKRGALLSSTKTSPNAPNPPRKLNVLLHDRNALRMNSTQIRILEKMHHERLGSFLQGLDRVRLPAQFGADFRREKVERDFADEAGKGEFGD
ncbi:hypothetical protein F1880_009584 [Penicillium rolfsii]|nr:hypothetical protein F1880_009584 [Penicillium rolfsii]